MHKEDSGCAFMRTPTQIHTHTDTHTHTHTHTHTNGALHSHRNNEGPGGSVIKNPPDNAEDTGVNAWVGKSPWRRRWQSTLLFLLGKFYGQRNTVGDSPRGRRRVGHDLATKDNHL